jgi:hypothetical protein
VRGNRAIVAALTDAVVVSLVSKDAFGLPVRIVADKIGKDGVRRIKRQLGPLPIAPSDEPRIRRLLRTMRNERSPLEARLQAARTLAPYFHAQFEITDIRLRITINPPETSP